MPADKRGSYYDENGEYHIADYDPDVIIKEDKSTKKRRKKSDAYKDINDEELKPPAPPVW